MRLCGIFPFLTLICTSCTLFSRNAEVRTITPPGHGKWLAAISIGAHIGDGPTLEFRNLLAPILTSESGGSYKLALDISDAGEHVVQKNQVFEAISALAQEVRTWKSAHPDKRALVAWVVTGHGFFRPNQGYQIQLGSTDSDLVAGSEFADLLTSVQADEHLVFLQSCHGGGLLRGTNAFHHLAQSMVSRRQGMAVVTAIHEFSATPTNASTQIYGEALKALLKGGDAKFVTYAQFKSELTRQACAHKKYIPRELFEPTPDLGLTYVTDLNASGVNVQILDAIDPDVPIFLTESGIGAWKNGTLQTPEPRPAQRDVPPSPEVREICQGRLTRMLAGTDWTLDSRRIRQIFEESADDQQISRLIDSLRLRTFSLAERRDLRAALASNTRLGDNLLDRFEPLLQPVFISCLDAVRARSIFCRAAGMGEILWSDFPEQVCLEVHNDRPEPLRCRAGVFGNFTDPAGIPRQESVASDSLGITIPDGGARSLCLARTALPPTATNGQAWHSLRVHAECSRD